MMDFDVNNFCYDIANHSLQNDKKDEREKKRRTISDRQQREERTEAGKKTEGIVGGNMH